MATSGQHERKPLAPIKRTANTAPVGGGQHIAAKPGSGASPTGMSIATLVLGILGFLMILPFVGPLLAVILGRKELNANKRAKKAGHPARGGIVMTQVGFWLGVVALAIQSLLLILFLSAIVANQNAQNGRDDLRRKQLEDAKQKIETYAKEHNTYPRYLSDIKLDQDAKTYSFKSSNKGYSSSEYMYTYTAEPSECGPVKYENNYYSSDDYSDTPCTSFTLTSKLEGSEKPYKVEGSNGAPEKGILKTAKELIYKQGCSTYDAYSPTKWTSSYYSSDGTTDADIKVAIRCESGEYGIYMLESQAELDKLKADHDGLFKDTYSTYDRSIVNSGKEGMWYYLIDKKVTTSSSN